MHNFAVISGGTKGIGRSLIEKFAEKKFDIVTCARTEKDLNKLKDQIEKAFTGITLYIFRADLSKKQDINKFSKYILSLNRPIDVLINNTGLFIPGQIHNEPEGTLEKMIETNLYSAYYLTRGLIDIMIQRKKGYIFNICSTASIIAYTNGGSYGISKFAMLGMSKVLREEMKAYNIRVTSVLPGATYTASWQGVDIPQERFMKSEDVAQTVWTAYNLSPQSVVEEILIRPLQGDL